MQRFILVTLFCLGFVFTLSACQFGENRRNLRTEPAPAALTTVMTDQTTLPAASATQPAAADQENDPQPTSTATALVTPDPAAQDLDSLLNQLNQMNQSGDAFDDLP